MNADRFDLLAIRILSAANGTKSIVVIGSLIQKGWGAKMLFQITDPQTCMLSRWDLPRSSACGALTCFKCDE